MKILVCVNHVPDTEAKIKIGADNCTIDKTGVNYILNPYDEIALEEGLRTKEKLGGEVIAVSCGGDSHKETLRKALAMGVDKAVLLKDDAQRDAFGVAKALAGYAAESEAEIIFTGKQSIDYDGSQMGSFIAELLGWPSISVTIKLEIADGKITAHREIEGGHEVVQSSLPAVVTAQKGLNEPRYPSLKGIMAAKSKPIEEKIPAVIDPKVRVVRMRKPAGKSAGRIVGTDSSAIPELVRLLHEEAKVI
jgi:electron transfer flavoprotein beta subunit